MAKKKRPIGVMIFAVLAIIVGILVCRHSILLLFFVTWDLYFESRFDYYIHHYLPLWLKLIFGISGIIAGMLLFSFKNWVRKVYLFLMLVWSFLGFWFTGYYNLFRGVQYLQTNIITLVYSFFIFILPTIIGFYYFDRPKVKALFSPERNETGSKVTI